MNLHRYLFFLSVSIYLCSFGNRSSAQELDCGITWNPAVQLSSDSVLSNVPQISISGDTIHIIWFGLDTLGTQSDDGVQYSHSYDGGQTFSQQVTLSSPDTAASTALVACSGANVYVAFVAVIDTFSGTVVIRSTDAGTTWLPPQQVRSRGFLKTLEASGNNVFLGFYYYRTPTDIRNGIMLSTDLGATWSLRNSNAPALVSMTMVGSKLHGVLQTLSNPAEVYYEFSIDSAKNWAFGDVLSREDFTNSLYPRIASNGTNELYAVWNDAGAIKMRRSRNGGSAWLPEIIISEQEDAVFTDIAAAEEFACAAWDGGGTIDVRPSNDFGFTFCPTQFPATGTRAGEPVLKMSGTTLHAAWSEIIGGNSEIFYRKGSLTKNPRLAGIPTEFALKENFPNPFNDVTHISFEVPAASHVNITVYDILGQRVEQLVDRDMQAGRYDVLFSSRNRASGVYFYRLQTPSITQIRKLVITR